MVFTELKYKPEITNMKDYPDAYGYMWGILLFEGLVTATMNMVLFIVIRLGPEFIKPSRRDYSATFYHILSMLIFTDMVFGITLTILVCFRHEPECANLGGNQPVFTAVLTTLVWAEMGCRTWVLAFLGLERFQYFSSNRIDTTHTVWEHLPWSIIISLGSAVVCTSMINNGFKSESIWLEMWALPVYIGVRFTFFHVPTFVVVWAIFMTLRAIVQANLNGYFKSSLNLRLYKTVIAHTVPIVLFLIPITSYIFYTQWRAMFYSAAHKPILCSNIVVNYGAFVIALSPLINTYLVPHMKESLVYYIRWPMRRCKERRQRRKLKKDRLYYYGNTTGTTPTHHARSPVTNRANDSRTMPKIHVPQTQITTSTPISENQPVNLELDRYSSEAGTRYATVGLYDDDDYTPPRKNFYTTAARKLANKRLKGQRGSFSSRSRRPESLQSKFIPAPTATTYDSRGVHWTDEDGQLIRRSFDFSEAERTRETNG